MGYIGEMHESIRHMKDTPGVPHGNLNGNPNGNPEHDTTENPDN